MNKYFLIFSFILAASFAGTSYAAQPVCHSTSSGGYCQYKGKVDRLYVNDRNQILMYFEQSIAVSDAEVAGFTISNGRAGIYVISNNPNYAKMLYSTLLAANSQDRIVTVQMHGTASGYLEIDRVWFGG